ncbi:MAG: ABC transporter ATP-binding protein [Clostridia bacterium]|nr:ABC transporter ATP-binding protein [Clostridia bacterium]
MIEVKGLVKRYGSHTAVENLSFTVETGQVYGFLGPNGAGKSTTMNMITGCISATEGQVLIDGHDIFEEPLLAKRQIGYLPEIPPLYTDFSVREYLKFVCQLKGLKKAEIKPEIERVLAKADVADVADRLIKTLSKGYRQRVGLAQALVGDPAIIILDEPSIGLDPKQIIQMRELIRSLGREHTVILSSHILSEVSEVCDHILIIKKGKLIGNGTPEELASQMQVGTTLTVEVMGDEAVIREALAGIEGEIKISAGNQGAFVVEITTAEQSDLRSQVSIALSSKGLVILSMNLAQASLEDVFLELTYGDAELPAAEESQESEEDAQ